MDYVEVPGTDGERALFFDCGCLMRIARHDDGVLRRTFDTACDWGCQASLTAIRELLLDIMED